MGECDCHKYNKRINVPAFRELRLMQTRIALNDTKVEIKRTIETKRMIETKRTIETLQTIETIQTTVTECCVLKALFSLV